jgi:hypothetical protein
MTLRDFSETDIFERNKPEMVTKLEMADKKSRFPRFLELAPELRCMVYMYAMDDKPRVRPAPPPISRTCQLIRAESLPIFFKHVTVSVVVTRQSQEEPSHGGDAVIFRGKGRSMHMAKKYFDYFKYATKMGWVRHMRRFRWNVASRMSVVPGGIRRELNEKYFVAYSKNLTSGQITGTKQVPQGRLAPDAKGIARSVLKEEKEVIDGRPDAVFEWFKGVYEKLNEKPSEKNKD